MRCPKIASTSPSAIVPALGSTARAAEITGYGKAAAQVERV